MLYTIIGADALWQGADTPQTDNGVTRPTLLAFFVISGGGSWEKARLLHIRRSHQPPLSEMQTNKRQPNRSF